MEWGGFEIYFSVSALFIWEFCALALQTYAKSIVRNQPAIFLSSPSELCDRIYHGVVRIIKKATRKRRTYIRNY